MPPICYREFLSFSCRIIRQGLCLSTSQVSGAVAQNRSYYQLFILPADEVTASVDVFTGTSEGGGEKGVVWF